jgi:hypothetical protein
VGVEPGTSGAVGERIGYGGLIPAPDYIRSAFPRQQEVYILNVGICACSFFSDPMDEEEEEAIRRHGRKKGWSLTKINRSVENRSHTGGLALEITRRVSNAARDGAMSLLVFWDDNETTPTGGHVVIPANTLVEKRMAIRANRVVMFE